MFENLYKVIGNYSAYPLLLCSETIEPGTLLQTVWDWMGMGDKPEKFLREEGCPWKLLKIKNKKAFDADYPNVLNDASIIVGDITGKVDFSGELALPQFGFSAAASFGKKETVKFKVSGIKVRSFEDGFDQYILRQQLRQLKNSEPESFPWVDGDFLVTDCYYISGLQYEFSEDSKIDVKAAYEKLGKSVSGGFKLEIKNNTTLELIGTAKTPFAVRGIKV